MFLRSVRQLARPLYQINPSVRSGFASRLSIAPRWYSTNNKDVPVKGTTPVTKGPTNNGDVPGKGKSPRNKDEGPRVRYLIYVFLFSTGVLMLATRKVNNKAPQNSFTEREYEEYERTSGLKRRSKVVTDTDKYRFYVVPYVHLTETVDKIAAKLPKDKELKIIDPAQLIARELADPSAKYSLLLQDLNALGKPFPKGLITALIKNEVQFYLNTTKGTYDTNFLITNYPQSTDEATRFENNVADITKCLVLKYDVANEMPVAKNAEQKRLIQNVIGYFDTVNKAHSVEFEHDEMDDKLTEIVLEDI